MPCFVSIEFLLLSCSPAVVLQSQPKRCWLPSTSYSKSKHHFFRPFTNTLNSPVQAEIKGIPLLPSSCFKNIGIYTFNILCPQASCFSVRKICTPQDLNLLKTFYRKFCPKLHCYPSTWSVRLYLIRAVLLIFFFFLRNTRFTRPDSFSKICWHSCLTK